MDEHARSIRKEAFIASIGRHPCVIESNMIDRNQTKDTFSQIEQKAACVRACVCSWDRDASLKIPAACASPLQLCVAIDPNPIDVCLTIAIGWYSVLRTN